MKRNIGSYIPLAVLFLCGLLVFPAFGHAEKMPSYLGVGVGRYNVFDANSGTYYVLDYRPPLGAYGLGSWITLAGAEEEMGYYSAGVLKDIYLSSSMVLTPSFGVGLFNQAGGEMVLGDPVEFRSAVKLSYEFWNKSRLGICLDPLQHPAQSRLITCSTWRTWEADIAC